MDIKFGFADTARELVISAAGDQAELTQKIATLKLSKEARTKATSELKKLKTMAPMSAEA